jgi:hypothetical protein
MGMTKCVKPLSDLITLSAKSSKWRVLIGSIGTTYHLKVTESLNGLTHFVIS